MTESELKSNDEISDDDEQQLIKLSLKKPNDWNWELTTSKSNQSIAFPMIQLYDENSETLLAVADEADIVASSKKLRKSATMSNGSSSSLRSVRTKDSFKIKIHRDSTNEFTVEPWVMIPEDAFGDVKRKKSSNASSPSTTEQQMVSDNRKKTLQLPSKTKRSVSSSSIRSRSSILERISELKKDLSSTDESDHEEQTRIRKRYSHRTCSVGTILVPKESFSNETRRRARKPYLDSDELKNANKLDCTSGE
jgi:hypothetical protein